MTYRSPNPLPPGRPDPRSAKGKGVFLRPGYCMGGCDFDPKDGLNPVERAAFLSGTSYARKPFSTAMYGVKAPLVW